MPGDPLWRPPTDQPRMGLNAPYDWMKERGYPKFPRSWDWEEIVATMLGIGAVLLAFWLLWGFVG